MSAFYIKGIPSQFVNRMWAFAEPYVKRALDHSAGELSPSDLRLSCASANCQLWLVSHENRIVGAAVTEIVVYPNRKHCRVITISGSCFSDWVGQMDAILCQWAASLGCDALEAHVRKGFVQKLDPLGYRHLHSVVVKELAEYNPAEDAQGGKDGQEG